MIARAEKLPSMQFQIQTWCGDYSPAAAWPIGDTQLIEQRFRGAAAAPAWAAESAPQQPLGSPDWAQQPASAVPPKWAVPATAAAAVGRQRKPQPAAKASMVSGAAQLAQLGLLGSGVHQVRLPPLLPAARCGCCEVCLAVCS